MKRIVVLMCLICFTLINFNIYAQKKNNKEEVTFDVSMTCNNCKKKIERNIPFEKGVKDLKVDLPSKTVTVVYQSDKTDTGKLQKAFEKLGYNADLHEDEE